jgi:hypothetical protein
MPKTYTLFDDTTIEKGDMGGAAPFQVDVRDRAEEVELH